MKILLLLALPLLFSSCALIQLPARLVSEVLAPLAANDQVDPAGESIGVALQQTGPGR